MDELKLNGIETSALLSPIDTTLGSIERNLQIASIVGGIAAWNVFAISPQHLFYISLGLLFLWTLDSVLYSTPGLKLLHSFDLMNELEFSISP